MKNRILLESIKMNKKLSEKGLEGLGIGLVS